jgi:hypothetical protein
MPLTGGRYGDIYKGIWVAEGRAITVALKVSKFFTTATVEELERINKVEGSRD